MCIRDREECFADPEIKAQVDAEVAASMAENEMMDAYANAEARAEGNVLIYDYTGLLYTSSACAAPSYTSGAF